MIRGSEVQLWPAERVSVYERVAVMNAAYVDYYIPMNVSTEYMRMVDRANDVDHSRSVVARANGRTIGIALVGLRGERAWVGGVGVVPEWRRRGVAREMMSRILADAKATGGTSVTLEVLIQNEAARRLYSGLGFAERRELLSWYRREDVAPPAAHEASLSPVSADVLLLRSDGWSGSRPPWQHEQTSLRRISTQLHGFRLAQDGAEAAYCVVNDRSTTVSVMSVGIRPDLDYTQLGRELLEALAFTYAGRAMHFTNVPSGDGLSRILPLLRFSVTAHQIEMSCAVS